MTQAARYQRFDTAPGTGPGERFEYWRSWYSQAVDGPMRLDPAGPLPADFRAWAEVASGAHVDVIEVHCGPAVGSWRREDIEPADRLRLVLLAPAPGGAACWHGQQVPLARGGTALLGRTDGWWRAPDGLRAIQVNVPQAAVAVPDAWLAALNDPRLLRRDPVLRSLAGPALAGLAGRLPDLSAVRAADVDAVWVSLVTMLVRSLAGQDLSGAELAPARQLQAQRFIRAHLADSRLSPGTIAAALHISRRTLYAALGDGEPGIAAQIRQQRMARARAMLADPAQRQPIAEIARQVGLPDPAHFSRLFRARFGHSPRELRGHPGGQAPAAGG